MQRMAKSIAEQRPGAGPWRELVRLILASLATGAVVSIVLALAVFMVATEASAAPRLADGTTGAARTAGTAHTAGGPSATLAAIDAPPV